MKSTTKKKTIGVGMPTCLYFEDFGEILWEVFGKVPYHVGSSLTGKSWRDVDVRIILDDEEYEKQGFGDPKYPHQNAKWMGVVKAFSLLGKEMTGLPIDFQIQQTSSANKDFEGARSALLSHKNIHYA